MSDKYSDRFSDETKEQPEKSAFECETCKTKYGREEAKKKDMSCCGRTLTELMQEGFGP